MTLNDSSTMKCFFLFPFQCFILTNRGNRHPDVGMYDVYFYVLNAFLNTIGERSYDFEGLYTKYIAHKNIKDINISIKYV